MNWFQTLMISRVEYVLEDGRYVKHTWREIPAARLGDSKTAIDTSAWCEWSAIRKAQTI